MGSFEGYCFPGTFFIILGVWCKIVVFTKFFRCGTKKSVFVCTPTQVCWCPPCRAAKTPVEIEGLFKVIYCAVGLIVQFRAWSVCGGFCFGNWEHCVLYTLFGFAGMIDVMTHYKLGLPDSAHAQYSAMLLAFVTEAAFCACQLNGRSDLYVRVHTLLLVTILFCVVAIAAEMRFRHHPVLMLFRGWSVILHGSWFWQTGFILYTPEPDHHFIWEANNDEHLELANQMFELHCLVLTCVMVLLAVIVACGQMTVWCLHQIYPGRAHYRYADEYDSLINGNNVKFSNDVHMCNSDSTF